VPGRPANRASWRIWPVDKRLSQHIIDGERIGLEVALQRSTHTGYPPLQDHQHLPAGWPEKVVGGACFGSGQMQLPVCAAEGGGGGPLYLGKR